MGNGNHKKLYLLTLDLGEKVEYLRHVGITTPDPHSSFFKDIQSDLKKNLQTALPSDVSVEAISMADLSDDILAKATSIAGDKLLIVSTCPEIANPVKGNTIQVNRIVDFEGNSLGLGPRPGSHSIHEQVVAIKKAAENQPVVIVEDGMFHGETMEFIIEELVKHGVKVASVVVGFTFPESQPTIKSILDRGIAFHSIEEFHNLLDWVPDHDFFPFVPSNGKVVGMKIKGDYLPFYSVDQASLSIPYLYGFCDMPKWTSLGNEPARVFTTACIRAAISLFMELEKLTGKEIRATDLIHSKQRVSVPITTTQQMLPRADARVVSYLSEIL